MTKRAHPASEAVVATATRLADRLPPSDYVELAEHNEPIIALENLISNLDDHDIALSADEVAALATLAAALGLSELERDVVRALRRIGETRRHELVMTVALARTGAELDAAVSQRLGGQTPIRLRLWHWDELVARLPDDARALIEWLDLRGIEPVLVSGNGTIMTSS